jgi:hypothetical protein
MDPTVELFNPAYWLRDPFEGTLHPIYLAIGVVFVLIVAASIFVAVMAPRLARRHRVKIKLYREMAAWFGGVGALGLFWVLARLIGSPLFARPLWLWLTVIALAVVAAYYILYWRRRYPSMAQAYAEAERRRRWAPVPKRRATARRR